MFFILLKCSQNTKGAVTFMVIPVISIGIQMGEDFPTQNSQGGQLALQSFLCDLCFINC